MRVLRVFMESLDEQKSCNSKMKVDQVLVEEVNKYIEL